MHVSIWRKPSSTDQLETRVRVWLAYLTRDHNRHHLHLLVEQSCGLPQLSYFLGGLAAWMVAWLVAWTVA
ncbi:MAG: hypothetical protein KHZ79_01430 [Atopobium minutum]|uniref:hypothetical protein n=1 Tax=Atopobium minutum TaxID=1381 RepID=UPI00039B90BE|nr:hypothetical protein [Atopobium minutum]MBS4873032.1 hypothetical protein [Atopobium minutum]MDU5356544.1 hypothetical protein [Atopobium minutum]MDU5892492.1 hypothetical protein [Atopobium minutum]